MKLPYHDVIYRKMSLIRITKPFSRNIGPAILSIRNRTRFIHIIHPPYMPPLPSNSVHIRFSPQPFSVKVLITSRSLFESTIGNSLCSVLFTPWTPGKDFFYQKEGF